MTLYGEPVLVIHGDALCTDDRAYQRLRATVRDADWQRRFLGLSVGQRRALAGAARTGSQAHTAAIDYAIADVNADSVAAALRAAGVSTLLHGHTHRPAIHPFRSTAAPARASCSAIGTTRAACCAGIRAGPSSASLPRARPNESETGVRSLDELAPRERERVDARLRVESGALRRAARQIEVHLEMPRLGGMQSLRTALPTGPPMAGASAANRSQERASMNAPQIIRSTSRCGSVFATSRRNRSA